MMTEDDMVHPDPQLGKLIIAAARIRMEQQVRGIPAPEFKFPTEEIAPRAIGETLARDFGGTIIWEHPDDGTSITWPPETASI